MRSLKIAEIIVVSGGWIDISPPNPAWPNDPYFPQLLQCVRQRVSRLICASIYRLMMFGGLSNQQNIPDSAHQKMLRHLKLQGCCTAKLVSDFGISIGKCKSCGCLA